MGIITTSDIEQAYGIEIPDEDLPRYEFMIDLVSAYIEEATGQRLSGSTTETFVVKADSYGIIEFPSLDAVVSVEELDRGSQSYSPASYCFDGVESIYDLCPRQTYRVKVTYGDCVPPTAIIGVATQLVGAATGADTSSQAGIVKYRVGDVEETYGVANNSSGAPVVTLSSLQSKVLARYNVQDNTTLRPR